MRLSRGEKITLLVMGVIGAAFWVAALIVPGMTIWMIVFAAVLVGWVAFQFLMDGEREE